MTDSRALVSVVVVNFNGLGLVNRFLAGIDSSDYGPTELLVVDNASSDGSAEAYAARGIDVVHTGENLGYGGGCNAGAKRSTGDLLLFMNPDVTLEQDTIGLLVRDMESNPDAAIVCATTITPGHEHVRSPRVEDVATLAGGAMLVRRDHFERVGGFDPWIFLYSEDDDLCYRTWLAGRRVLKSWDAVAKHDLGGAGGGRRWSAEQIKNGLYVHLKTRAWPAVARYAGRMVAKTLLRGLRLRDPAVLAAWMLNLRELPATLEKRRAVRGSARREDLRRLEVLGAENARWVRRAWWRSVRSGLRAGLRRG